MKKTSRKRLLVSSVAMLLVAMLALGTATYAWFTSDPTAKADGLNVKATAATGLLIKSETEGKWTHNALLNRDADKVSVGADYAADPLSMDPTATSIVGYKTVAEFDSNYKAKDAETVSTSTAYYHEKINAKVTGTEATSANVKITSINFGVGSWSSALRMAVTYTNAAGDTSVVGIFSKAGAANKYLTGEGTYSAKLSSANYTFPSKTDTKTVSVDNNGECAFDVYVYLDGEDPTVYTDNITTLGNTTTGITINFAIAA